MTPALKLVSEQNPYMRNGALGRNRPTMSLQPGGWLQPRVQEPFALVFPKCS
jgi:hypothetical protein